VALLDDVTVTLCIATGEDGASEETVSLTLVGPSDRWFAVGFGSSTITMCNHMVSMSVQKVLPNVNLIIIVPAQFLTEVWQ